MAEAVSSPSTDILPIIGKWTAPPNSLQASLLLAFLSSAGLYYVNIFPAITNALMEGAGLSTVDAGQMAALGGFASKMGLACGPMVAGYVLSTDGSYPLLIVLAIGVIAACVAIAFYPARDLNRQAA